jgi:hypothetical protein
MKTHELEMDNFHSPDELVRFLEDNDLKKGDTLKVMTEEEIKEGVLVAFVVLIILAIAYIFNKTKTERMEDGQKILDDLFKGKTIEEIEESVQQEYGIKIEMEQKEPDHEREDWLRLSGQNISRAYTIDEPEYTEGDVKEPNPEYKIWKGK